MFFATDKEFNLTLITGKRALKLITGLMSPLLLASLVVLIMASVGCKPKETPEQKYNRLLNEAVALKTQAKLDEARIVLLNAIDLQPNNAQGFFELAEVLTASRQLPKALENYKITLDLNPNHRLARLRIAAFMTIGGELEQADAHTQKLIEANPNDIEAILISASIDTLRKNYSAAKEKINKTLQISPNHPQALASLADIAIKEGDGPTAELYYKKALDADPNNEAIRVSLADLYSRMGRLKDAENIVLSVLNANQGNYTLRFYYAEFLLEQGMAEKAIPQYEQILQQNPLFNEARDRLLDVYLERGMPDKARTLIQDFVTRFTKDPAAEYFNGRLAQLDNKPTEALAYFIKALTTLTNFAPAFRHAGLTELALGKQSEAYEHFNQAIAINSYDIGARLALARNALLKRDYAQAAEHLNKILSRHPRQLGANILRADLALVQNDLKTAQTIYQALRESFPNSPLPYLKLALLAEKQDARSEAIDHYKKVISFDRDSYIAINRLTHLLVITSGFDQAIQELTSIRGTTKNSVAECNYMLGELYRYRPNASKDDLAKARAYFEEALNLKPNFMPPYVSLADLDYKSGDVDQAIVRYQKIIASEPQHLPSLVLLALIYENKKDYSAAAENYRQILNFAPTFAPAANNLAWLIVEHLNGDLNEALSLAQLAKREMPNEANVADTLGWIYYKQGSFKAALTELEEALNLEQSSSTKQSAELFYHLALVKEALGEREEAQAFLKKAKDSASSASPLLTEINKLEEAIQ